MSLILGYQPTYGTVNNQQPGPYQQGGMPYPPAGAYDPSKVAGAYNPGPYPPQGNYPPQPGYPQPAGVVPPYGQAHTTHTNVHVHPTQSVVVVGGCPACRVRCLHVVVSLRHFWQHLFFLQDNHHSTFVLWSVNIWLNLMLILLKNLQFKKNSSNLMEQSVTNAEIAEDRSQQYLLWSSEDKGEIVTPCVQDSEKETSLCCFKIEPFRPEQNGTTQKSLWRRAIEKGQMWIKPAMNWDGISTTDLNGRDLSVSQWAGREGGCS